ncbi:hypothetical protein niasHS_000416 [Heterodera schachtii]|uniref:Uncharacterized protein n=2 Tax=Heterodera TaxID=34509 RepID=A0ABD2KT87_9BILA
MQQKVERNRKVEREAKAITDQYRHSVAAHWPYYFHCVYPGYQNAYYPDAHRSKYAHQDVTLDLWKWMVPGQMHKTNSLPHFRWYYPYDNWFRYY